LLAPPQSANAQDIMSEPQDPAIELILEAKPRLIDGFTVGRALPSSAKRSVGPFVFVDHMGPAQLDPGRGMDVRPHPHINLATVTYLFDGEILHRDSLGNTQLISPGAINWMTAGRGIVHSERSPSEARVAGAHLHGLQLWVALPEREEESDPRFSHHPQATLPELNDGATRMRVLAGSAYGASSPVPVSSALFYVEVELPAGARLPLPNEHEERAAYVISGKLLHGSTELPPRTLVVWKPKQAVELRAEAATRLMLLGGAPLGPRYMFWNFVSSRKERIEEAAREWKAGKFPLVPGDENEHIPLDIEPHFAQPR
jgi:redox-sensitive bicupin YhaK (pirin superfamily)